jgi:hypothetical protein
MAKKKKKVNSHVLQKVQAAQHKNMFIERVRKICALISKDEPMFDLLSHRVLEIIYYHRGASIKFKVAEESKITKRFVRIMYSHVEKEMKTKRVTITMGDVISSVNLVDYYQIVFPMETVLLAENCPLREKKEFQQFGINAAKRYEIYIKTLTNIIHSACICYGNLSARTMYTFVFSSSWSDAGPFSQVVTLNSYILDIRYIEINNERLPVIQTGEILHSKGISTLEPTTVSLKRLSMKNINGMKELPVYVRQHAVNRIMQRACCMYPGSVPSLIHVSFSERRKIIRDGDLFFVECYYYEFKIGYFIARIIDNMFVIQTFRLITHSSTPEGQKLAQLTGLSSDDMKFLAIDDLKTLINSDIVRDERISQIFIEAGCKSILKMSSEMNAGDFPWLWDSSKQNTELSKLISEYIQLGDKDKDYYENE